MSRYSRYYLRFLCTKTVQKAGKLLTEAEVIISGGPNNCLCDFLLWRRERKSFFMVLIMLKLSCGTSSPPLQSEMGQGYGDWDTVSGGEIQWAPFSRRNIR